ncbi:uncharacterized protein LOC133730083 [Rosa rugosa]|uniref:uncharacterized protein LOC133730083 n=1 Tax=Rosa rugosa TaxID=74645 RepID=UPI002B411334|nr:uncharacterized protein LOC133730083 [Rosa rugosa]
MYNLVHPVISGLIKIFTSGFRRKMIWNFVGLFGCFRGKEDTAGDPGPEEPEKILERPQSPVEPQTGSDEVKPKRVFCLICKGNGDHETINCPDKSEGYVTLCRICDDGPCENEDDPDHKEEHYEYLMLCDCCGAIGRHWEDTCSRNCSDNDCDFDPPSWLQ